MIHVCVMSATFGDVVVLECAACRGVQVGNVMHGRPRRVDFKDVSSDCLDEICYLGDTICAGGGVKPSSKARIRSGWKKFRSKSRAVASCNIKDIFSG